MRRVRTLPFFFFIFYMVFIITIIASQIIIMEAFDKTCFSNLCLGIFAIPTWNPRQNYQKYLSRFEVVIYWKWGPFQKCWHFHPFIVLSAKLIGSFLYCAFHRHCQVGQVEGILRGEARQQKLSFLASKQNVLCIKTQMGSGGGDGRHGWGTLDTVGELRDSPELRVWKRKIIRSDGGQTDQISTYRLAPRKGSSKNPSIFILYQYLSFAQFFIVYKWVQL